MVFLFLVFFLAAISSSLGKSFDYFDQLFSLYKLSGVRQHKIFSDSCSNALSCSFGMFLQKFGRKCCSLHFHDECFSDFTRSDSANFRHSDVYPQFWTDKTPHNHVLSAIFGSESDQKRLDHCNHPMDRRHFDYYRAAFFAKMANKTSD